MSTVCLADDYLFIVSDEKNKAIDKPNTLIEKIIEDFKFETPKNLPKISQ